MALHVGAVFRFGADDLYAVDEPVEHAAVVEVEGGEVVADEVFAVLQVETFAKPLKIL